MEFLHYQYLHSQTEATTGYFSCEPEPAPGLARLLELLQERPLDTFLRNHALRRFAALKPGEAAPYFAAALPYSSPGGQSVLAAFGRELALLNPDFAAALPGPGRDELAEGGAEANAPDKGARDKSSPDPQFVTSPLLLLRRAKLPDAGLHARWSAFFAENIQGHRALPAPEDCGLPPLFPHISPHDSPPAAPQASLPEISRAFSGLKPENAGSGPRPQSQAAPAHLEDLEALAELALERLQSCGVLAGPEQRHLASLSPVGLLMPWKIDVKVDSGRSKFTLQGTANTYGRGFSLARARVSCRMEMVERFSAYLSVSGRQVLDRASPTELLYGSLAELRRDGLNALDPNDFYLEAPYRGARLHWIRGLRVRRALDGSAREEEVYVPLQFAALFSNLDEPDLCSAPGSTGLATGLVPAQARLAGLLEILERDAEAGLLYRKNRCFALAASALGDEKLRVLLEDFHKLGINVQFMDMSGALGVPICQCFVIGAKGSLHRGHGASLSARTAILSALTETPYPYPGGGPSGPRLRRLPEVEFDALPDFSRGGPEEDLALLEALLCANGRDPVYVDLTHAGLAFPVVRALLPGAWLSADFDSFSRVSPRLYKDYVVG